MRTGNRRLPVQEGTALALSWWKERTLRPIPVSLSTV